MEIEMSVKEYKATIKRLVKLMKLPSIHGDAQKELERLLDKVDTYNGMDFLKVK